MVAQCERCGASGGGAYTMHTCTDPDCPECGGDGSVRCLCFMCAFADLLPEAAQGLDD